MKNLNSALFFLLSSASVFAGTCEEHAGQMMMVKMPPPPAANVGGAMIFGDSLNGMKTPNDVIQYINKLQNGRTPPLFVATDQEGGLVQRIDASRGFTPLPKPSKVGASGKPQNAFEFGRITSSELSAVGVN